MIIGTLHSGCIDPIQATARFVIILEGGIQKSDTATTILSNGKGNFGATNRNDRTGRSVPPSNIPVEPNRNGPFHLVSNRNFRRFGLNGKHPLLNRIATDLSRQ